MYYICNINFNINEYELKEYLKINLYEGISYINSLKILAQKDNMYANAQLGSLEYSGLISGKIDYEKCKLHHIKLIKNNLKMNRRLL